MQPEMDKMSNQVFSAEADCWFTEERLCFSGKGFSQGSGTDKFLCTCLICRPTIACQRDRLSSTSLMNALLPNMTAQMQNHQILPAKMPSVFCGWQLRKAQDSSAPTLAPLGQVVCS